MEEVKKQIKLCHNLKQISLEGNPLLLEGDALKDYQNNHPETTRLNTNEKEYSFSAYKEEEQKEESKILKSNKSPEIEEILFTEEIEKEEKKSKKSGHHNSCVLLESRQNLSKLIPKGGKKDSQQKFEEEFKKILCNVKTICFDNLNKCQKIDYVLLLIIVIETSRKKGSAKRKPN